ncbi:DUF7344 domain-containing protein [Halegenticoccus tardaugens]|uniref:DUF7344 domain-containing protein n=1 Tax=Halegenticoccus tardaugens TaxID=2071624 RepID=UPI00100A96A2|nr:hypothetical protein [Halegenticoccus tardaugens]
MTADETLAKGTLFDLLCNRRRLEIIKYLRTNGRQGRLNPIIDYVAATENGKQPTELTRAERRRVYVSVYQTHLPMLEEHGVVEWDQSENVVRLCADSDVERYLDYQDDSGLPWHWCYLGVAAASVAVVGAWVLGVIALGSASISWALALVSIAVLGLVLIRYVLERRARAFPSL